MYGTVNKAVETHAEPVEIPGHVIQGQDGWNNIGIAEIGRIVDPAHLENEQTGQAAQTDECAKQQ